MNRKIKILFICLSVFVAAGCSSTRPLDYSVKVKNKGNQMIVVGPFQITDGPVSTVAVGEVYPNGTAGMSPFYTRPFTNLFISWGPSTSGATRTAEVSLNLPKEFTKERGSCIDFFIFPDEQKVDVAYEILNPKTGQTDIVQQPPATSH